MFFESDPYDEPLGDGLVLRSLHTEADIESVSAFNGKMHGELVTAMSDRLIRHHPHTRPEHWLMIVDGEKVVATLCLLPWTWDFHGVRLKAGEMGIVGTDEAYRHRGLQRALVKRHRQLLREGGYLLSHIQGIPYFYRQFGYEYAMPLEGGWRLELHQINDAMVGNYSIRKATESDIPELMTFYNDTMKNVAIHAVRDEAIWRYLLTAAMDTETAENTWLLLNDDKPIGYWREEYYGFGEGLNINECSRMTLPSAQAMLYFLKQRAHERDKPFVRLNVPPQHLINRLIQTMGAQDIGRYAWQIHLPDVGGLLKALIPVFEQRLAKSALAGLSQRFAINLYREGFVLEIQDGQVKTVESPGFIDDGDLRCPPLVFAQLILGYRNVDELNAIYPDFSCSGVAKVLVDVLFPNEESFIHIIY